MVMEQHVIEDRIYEQARRAAKSALIQWYSGQWQRQAELVEDLHQELLYWYSKTVSTRRKMEHLSDPEVMVTFRHYARQLLSQQTHENNVFVGGNLYSSDSIKSALKNESTNGYLYTVLPLAYAALNFKYREAIDNRYVANITPQTKSDIMTLHRATRALTNQVNVLYLTTEKNIGSKNVVFPESIKPKGEHGDPTAGIALTLMEQRPDIRDEYLYESPWIQHNKGAAAEPVIEFGPSGKYRLTAAEHDLFQRVPGLIDLFIEQKQKEWEGV